MATKMVTLDDIDGSEGAETVLFSLHGVNYEIDLGSANTTKLEKLLQTYIDKGREAATKKPAAANGDTAKIREWLNANGHPVQPKGRVPQDLVDIYKAAQVATPPTAAS